MQRSKDLRNAIQKEIDVAIKELPSARTRLQEALDAGQDRLWGLQDCIFRVCRFLEQRFLQVAQDAEIESCTDAAKNKIEAADKKLSFGGKKKSADKKSE